MPDSDPLTAKDLKVFLIFDGLDQSISKANKPLVIDTRRYNEEMISKRTYRRIAAIMNGDGTAQKKNDKGLLLSYYRMTITWEKPHPPFQAEKEDPNEKTARANRFQKTIIASEDGGHPYVGGEITGYHVLFPLEYLLV